MRTKSGLGITNPSPMRFLSLSKDKKKGDRRRPMTNSKNSTKTNINYNTYDENTLFQQFNISINARLPPAAMREWGIFRISTMEGM